MSAEHVRSHSDHPTRQTASIQFAFIVIAIICFLTFVPFGAGFYFGIRYHKNNHPVLIDTAIK